MLQDRLRLALLATLPLALVVRANLDTATAHAPVRASFTINLVGASERPKKIDTDATGTAKFSYAETGPISYTVEVKGLLTNPTGAHIHGPSDTEGVAGVVVDLPLDSVIMNGTVAHGSIEMKDIKDSTTYSLEALKKLMKDGRLYVNVHTTKYPAGEIRGQFK